MSSIGGYDFEGGKSQLLAVRETVYEVRSRTMKKIRGTFAVRPGVSPDSGTGNAGSQIRTNGQEKSSRATPEVFQPR